MQSSTPVIKAFEIPSSESDSTLISSSGKMTIIIAFFVILAIESMGFFMLRSSIAQAMGQALIVLDLGSVIVLLLGAGTLAYFYYTRYVRKQVLFLNKKFTLKIGTRDFTYQWKEFSLVVLSTAQATYGPKGYSIRLYTDDLDGEYVELPIYRFKNADAFEIRKKIEEKIKQSAKADKNNPN
jgi:hypothetical protein